MYTDFIQYIKKQEKALARVKADQKENKQARDENVAKYPGRLHKVDLESEAMRKLIQETKRLDVEYKKLQEKATILDLRIRLAVCSVVALICESIRDEIKEGGRLCGVSSHYKKFAAVVEEKIQASGLEGLSAYLDLSYAYTLYLKWDYKAIRDESNWVSNKGVNGVAELNDNMKFTKPYEAGEIDKVVADYIREEKACYKLVDALEKKAKEISKKFHFVKRTGIGQHESLIYGADYGKRA